VKGLLMKDYYTLLKQMKLYLVFIAILSLMQNMSLSGLAVVYAAMLPITALAYDERSKWDSLAATMPYSSADVVLSKYVLGYLGIAVSCVLTFVIELGIAAYRQASFTLEQGIAILLIGCVGAFLLAIISPFMFWLGVERGRIVYFVLIAVTVFLGMMAGSQVHSLIAQANLSSVAIVAWAFAATAFLSAASIWGSIAIYRRKPR